MTDNTINSTNSQKMSVYCKTCACRGCPTGQELYNQGMWHGMAIGSKEELDRLKAENEQLKEEFKRLKESECIICKYANIGDKYYQTLQEIKAIAERGKDSVYSGKNYCIPILDLIIKAEEE